MDIKTFVEEVLQAYRPPSRDRYEIMFMWTGLLAPARSLVAVNDDQHDEAQRQVVALLRGVKANTIIHLNNLIHQAQQCAPKR